MNRLDGPTLGPGVPHLDDDRCLELVHGLLGADEVEQVMRHLRECSGCEAKVRRATADREALRTRHSRGEEAMPGVRGRRTPAVVRIWAPLAAAAALVIVFAVRPDLLGRHPSGDRWIPVEHEEILRRAPEGGADAQLRQGLAAYERRDATAAVRALRASRASGGEDRVRRLYLASALVWTARPAEALGELDSLPPSALPEPWRSEALWVRYLALERSGRRDEARAQLRALANAPGDVGRLARARLR